MEAISCMCWKTCLASGMSPVLSPYLDLDHRSDRHRPLFGGGLSVFTSVNSSGALREKSTLLKQRQDRDTSPPVGSCGVTSVAAR
jgi:hypothetical protein